MTLSFKENGDVKIYDIKITNSNGSDTKDIRGQVKQVSIYEDLEEPTLFCDILIDDQIDLVTKLPILGEETVSISFKSPFRDDIITYKLRVFNISSEAVIESNLGKVYKLQCVSSDHFNGTTKNVQRYYEDTIDNIVKDILTNIIKTDKKLFIEQTKGIIKWTMPRCKAFEAIDLLRQRAISATAKTGGVFVFYEDQLGYHFVSLETLLEKGKSTIGSRVFTYSPATKEDPQREAHNFRNLINFEHLKKTDTAGKLSGGVFNNITKSYDILTKGFEEVKFKLTEQAGKIETGQNKKTTLPNSASFINDQSSNDAYKFFAPKDSSKNPDFIADYLSYKQAYATLFNQNIVRGYVHGDSNLKAGDLIELKLPDTSGIKTSDKKDSNYSGNYILTKLRHFIYLDDGRFKHRVSFDCNKVGW